MSRRRGAVDCGKISDVIHDTRGITMVKDFVLNPQEKSQWCYASAIEAVLRHYGIEDTQKNIASWYQTREGGCDTNKKGYNCPQDPYSYLEHILGEDNVYSMKKDNPKLFSVINKQIQENKPLIALIDGHYIVIVGYDDGNYYYYDPMHGSSFTALGLEYGLRKIASTCLLSDGVIPVEYADQHDNVFMGKSMFKGVLITKNPRDTHGGKRNTRRRRGIKRRAKKTMRRR